MKILSLATPFAVLVTTFGLISCAYAPGPSDPSKGDMMRLTAVATNLDRPLFVTAPPGDPRLFIVEQGGRILVRKEGVVLETPFLDLSALIGRSSGERGLLGLAFHPHYPNNGIFYVSYTDTEGSTVVALYCAYADDPDRGNPETADIRLVVDQPYSNHNGGMIAFGPDGYLYVAMGDGGSANDPGENGQALDTLLGKLLRIDVDSEMPYAIPPTNPFVGVAGAREEIWAYGLRNPWRFSFDRDTGDLWIGDVGQNALEEINYQPADSLGGENYGWRIREGNQCRPGEVNCDLPGAIAPIHVYANVGSQSITGGYVYRGTAIPDLPGTYFFADYITGSVYALEQENGTMVEVTDETPSLNTNGITLSNISSFGEDGAGELYIVDYGTGTVYQMTGA